MPLPIANRLRIDTSVVSASSNQPTTSARSSSRNGANSASISALTPGSSKLRSAKSAQRLRTPSSASTSSSASNPSRALDKATAPSRKSYTQTHSHASSTTSSMLPPPQHADNTGYSPIESSSEGEQDAFTYVLAMHDYDPPAISPSTASNAVTCLSFRAGQVVRLYNRDPSGWWDGEVDGRRGWFPSNYVTSDVDLLKDEELPGMLRSSSKNGHAHNMSTSSAASWASSSSTRPLIPKTFNRTDHRPTVSTSTFASATSAISSAMSSTSSDAYCPPLMVPLLHALSLLSTVVRERRHAHLQPATACIISCVRSVLSELGCLQRDAPVLKSHTLLARERKRILADLGGLVEGAKAASAVDVGGVAGIGDAEREREAEGMIKRASELFAHVRSFLAVAAQCGIDVQPPSKAVSQGTSQGEGEGRWDSQEGTLVKSDGDQDEWKGKENGTTNGVGERYQRRKERERETTVTPSGHLRAKSLSDLRNQTPPDVEENAPAMPVGNPAARIHLKSLGRAAGKQWSAQQGNGPGNGSGTRFVSAPLPHTHHKSAQSSVSSIASTSSSFSSSSGSSSSSSSSAHTTPPTPPAAFPTGPTPAPLLLAALRNTHDTYLSTIAAFIGHAHSHTRTSHASSTGHMYDLVREVVEVVCRLLTIVEAVLRCPSESGEVSAARKQELRRVKEGLYDVTSTLADAVRRLTTTADERAREGVGGEEATEEEEKAALLRCATNALKAGADCVSAVKKCLQRAMGEGGRPFVILMPDPEGEGGVDAGAYTFTPSKFSHAHSHSYSHLHSHAQKKSESDRTRVRSKSALQQLYTVNGVAEDEDEDLTIQAQTVSFNVEDTPRKLEPTVPEEREPRAEILLSVLSAPNTEDEATTPVLHSRAQSQDKPLPPLQIESSLEPESRSQSPISSVSVAPTDDGTTWEGGHTPQQSQLPLSLQDKLRNGELPPVPESALPDLPSSRSDPLAWLLSHDHPPDDVAYNSEGQLVGASLEALVERMTPHDALVEPAFAAVFFLTFRQFTTPSELVSALIARYNIVPPGSLADGEMFLWQQQKGLPVRLRVSNFVKSWLESYWRPAVDNVVLPELLAFTRDALALMFPVPSQRILDLIQSWIVARENGVNMKVDRVRDAGIPLNPPSIQPSEVPRPIMTKALLSALRAKNYSAISVTDFDPLELARQLTTMECTLYCSISSEEVLETGQSGGTYPGNVKAVTSLSTVITGWVAEGILDEPDTKKRTALVKFFIKVADRCVSLQNFSTPRSILAALDSSTISRLHQTWSGLPQKNRVQLEALRRLAEHARNYHEYRARLRNTAPPAVPFLGLYLTDITFCREGNPSHRASPKNPDKKLLNFNKYHKLARIVQDMQRFQVPYNLKAIPEVQEYLKVAFEQSKNRTDLQDLYRRSLLVEPKRPADTPPTGDMRQLFQWATRSQSSQATPASAS